jgi:hypothetical protein
MLSACTLGFHCSHEQLPAFTRLRIAALADEVRFIAAMSRENPIRYGSPHRRLEWLRQDCEMGFDHIYLPHVSSNDQERDSGMRGACRSYFHFGSDAERAQ